MARLLRYTKQGGTELLLDKIHFANGVTLAHDESYVLVCETPRARILRYWLKGPKGKHTQRPLSGTTINNRLNALSSGYV
jgi:sugar lactone lactonase YvrE